MSETSTPAPTRRVTEQKANRLYIGMAIGPANNTGSFMLGVRFTQLFPDLAEQFTTLATSSDDAAAEALDKMITEEFLDQISEVVTTEGEGDG